MCTSTGTFARTLGFAAVAAGTLAGGDGQVLRGDVLPSPGELRAVLPRLPLFNLVGQRPGQIQRQRGGAAARVHLGVDLRGDEGKELQVVLHL